MGGRAIRCAVLLVAWLAAVHAGGKGSNEPGGVGAYAYQDTDGNRYGGTYDLNAEDLQRLVYAPAFPDYFGPPAGFPGFPADFPGFPADFPDFLKQLQSSIEQFGPGGNHGGSSSYSGSSSFSGVGNGHENFGNDNMAQGMNYQHPQDGSSAYAAGSIGPDGIRQVASINPADANNPNIDVSSRSSGGGDGFYSVSSSSYASSSDRDGKRTSSRGAKTVVNDNGNVKQYEVHN